MFENAGLKRLTSVKQNENGKARSRVVHFRAPQGFHVSGKPEKKATSGARDHEKGNTKKKKKKTKNGLER